MILNVFLNKKVIQNHVFEYNLNRSIKKFFFLALGKKIEPFNLKKDVFFP